MTIEATLHRANGALTTLSNGRHVWNADVDRTAGSLDRAPDPHDLLDAALASCTTLTLELYIRRRQMAVTDLRVTVDRVEGKNEQGQVTYHMLRRISIEGPITDAERSRLMEIADKCPIHKLLTGQISIQSEMMSSSHPEEKTQGAGNE
ncbi:OsmC family protein [Undibacterium sp. MH2W]|uniref:OsmC family protein n=1 Tax=Undibacterium sp. MH2W TaxID=3413044 RepID=UPI003BF3F5BE